MTTPPEPPDAEISRGMLAEAPRSRPAPDSKKADSSQATRLARMALQHYELGCTATGEPYAIPKTGPRVVRLLRGGRGSLRAELARAYYQATGAAASQSALADALLIIEGTAQTVDPVELHLRVGAHNRALVLDLGDATGRAVVITAHGWQVVDEPPVRFRRTALTAELPTPVRGGNLADLWSAINVAEKYRPILAAVEVSALMPLLPHPVVLVTGEHGTGKTTATKRLASVADPCTVGPRKPPKDAEAATIAAAGSWCVALDNLSSMPDWLSDCVCRWSTGEGDVRRRLYSDGDLHVIAFRRIPILAGIDLGAFRGDLADRVVHVALERIETETRREDTELNDEWRRTHPRILGAVLDLTAEVLRILPTVHLDQMPRMADFARVLATVDKVLGTDGLATYQGLRDELAQDAASSDPVLVALAGAITEKWIGTSADLLGEITATAKTASDNPEKWRAPKDWPTTARSLTAVLHRQAPTLRTLGWRVTELPRETTRARVLRWELAPPPSEGRRKTRCDAADAAPGGISAGQSDAAGAATGAAQVRQTPGDAAPAANASATPHLAAPVAAPALPTMSSTNEDHAANAASAARFSPLLQTCDLCGAKPTRVDPNGRRLCTSCAPHLFPPQGCGCAPSCPDGVCLLAMEAS